MQKTLIQVVSIPITIWQAPEVMAPELPDLFLPAHVPHRELDAPVLHGLDVEADSGDRVDGLAKPQLVENRRLTRCIKAKEKNVLLFRAEDRGPQRRERKPHQISPSARLEPKW